MSAFVMQDSRERGGTGDWFAVCPDCGWRSAGYPDRLGPDREVGEHNAAIAHHPPEPQVTQPQPEPASGPPILGETPAQRLLREHHARLAAIEAKPTTPPQEPAEPAGEAALTAAVRMQRHLEAQESEVEVLKVERDRAVLAAVEATDAQQVAQELGVDVRAVQHAVRRARQRQQQEDGE